MCGISGILYFDRRSAAVADIAFATRTLAHRGPDGEGVIARGPAALGHRRLSIIDPPGGHQPLANEDGHIWTVCNGEIYNYRELREFLQSRQHVFRTDSDTEVIVHAYEEWGDACVERLRGMFAFAILDGRRGRAFMARDHFGIKPLYYLTTDTFFAFASELQALRRLPGVDWTIDLTALDEYLRLQYIPAPRTVYSHVRKLPPACRFSVTFDGCRSAVDEYWQLEFHPNAERSEEDTLEELDDVLRDSVRAHLVADVPFGAFLSGGVDSSTIVGYMTEILGRPVETFSVGFGEPAYDELPYAREAAARLGAHHHEQIVRPDGCAILPRLVQHYGEPFGDTSAIPTYFVSGLARTRVAMVLSGDGADEMFAGYEDSYLPWLQQQGDLRAGEPSLGAWLQLVQVTPYACRHRLWHPEFRASCSDELPTFEKEFQRGRHLSPCTAVQRLDIKTYLPYAILTKVDVASMMHGLEVRTPMVDLRVMEFAATIPESYSVKREDDHWAGKLMLKRNAARWYPHDFLNRPKQGFGLPMTQWFGPDGMLAGVVNDRLVEDASSPLCDYFDPVGIAEIVQAKSHSASWLLLVLDEWLRYERSTLTIRHS